LVLFPRSIPCIKLKGTVAIWLQGDIESTSRDPQVRNL
jgi:hypothetical protein